VRTIVFMLVLLALPGMGFADDSVKCIGKNFTANEATGYPSAAGADFTEYGRTFWCTGTVNAGTGNMDVEFAAGNGAPFITFTQSAGFNTSFDGPRTKLRIKISSCSSCDFDVFCCGSRY